MDLDPDYRIDEDEDDNGEDEQPVQRDANFMERKLLDSRILMLCGPVTDKMHREATARLLVLEAMDPEKPVNIFINSPGGSADSGFALYDILRFVPMPVNTIVNGLCASAGILIALATSKERRFCMPESRFMIHQPSTMGRGTASDLDITAREVIKLRHRYIKIISEQAGVDAEKILEDAHRDFWLDASEAEDYGLVAKVLAHRKDLPE